MSGENLYVRLSSLNLGQDIGREAHEKRIAEGTDFEVAADHLMIDLIAKNPGMAQFIGTDDFRYGLDTFRLSGHRTTGENDE